MEDSGAFLFYGAIFLGVGLGLMYGWAVGCIVVGVSLLTASFASYLEGR